ncbi:hypothetical protein [Commensalibacter papalotli (ex Servin-Garciduenas et al. 2014)]|uniref:Uncharacterized protein n=1 Tax=Commensalibacter papalotli (ex Servin-Garciduenas et al. 2014) TaxID=1208583 RepID=W7DUT7_9PROT|nr:hypothetical protein [Commensalibacter papalotli (ex Servin-Garciduenas et al. 2014)]EUK18018.1 hypothetical protein COMX_08495 [Commensalibacter papalotli (ex Servin-Garciduenas et al. 2014)]
MKQFTKITELAQYTNEQLERGGGLFGPSPENEAGQKFWLKSNDQSLAENTILLETLKLFMKRIYAQEHSEEESIKFFDQLICQAFYNAQLYPGDVFAGEKLLKNIIDS